MKYCQNTIKKTTIKLQNRTIDLDSSSHPSGEVFLFSIRTYIFFTNIYGRGPKVIYLYMVVVQVPFYMQLPNQTSKKTTSFWK